MSVQPAVLATEIPRPLCDDLRSTTFLDQYDQYEAKCLSLSREPASILDCLSPKLKVMLKVILRIGLAGEITKEQVATYFEKFRHKKRKGDIFGLLERINAMRLSNVPLDKFFPLEVYTSAMGVISDQDMLESYVEVSPKGNQLRKTIHSSIIDLCPHGMARLLQFHLGCISRDAIEDADALSKAIHDIAELSDGEFNKQVKAMTSVGAKPVTEGAPSALAIPPTVFERARPRSILKRVEQTGKATLLPSSTPPEQRFVHGKCWGCGSTDHVLPKCVSTPPEEKKRLFGEFQAYRAASGTGQSATDTQRRVPPVTRSQSARVPSASDSVARLVRIDEFDEFDQLDESLFALDDPTEDATNDADLTIRGITVARSGLNDSLDRRPTSQVELVFPGNVQATGFLDTGCTGSKCILVDTKLWDKVVKQASLPQMVDESTQEFLWVS